MGELVESYQLQGQSGQEYVLAGLSKMSEMVQEFKVGVSGLQDLVYVAKVHKGSIDIMATEQIVSEVKKLSKKIESVEDVVIQTYEKSREFIDQKLKIFDAKVDKIAGAVEENSRKITDVKTELKTQIGSINVVLSSKIDDLKANDTRIEKIVGEIEKKIAKYGWPTLITIGLGFVGAWIGIIAIIVKLMSMK